MSVPYFDWLELSKVYQYRTPKDKIMVFINFIENVIKLVGEREEKMYMLYIAYCLIKSEIMMLKASLRFIKLFRNAERLKSFEGRYFNLMNEAVFFIDKLNSHDLNMTPEEFDAKYVMCEKMCGARFEEQITIWRYAPILVQKEKSETEKRQKRILQEVEKILGKTKKLLWRELDKLAVAQLKEIAAVHIQLVNKVEELYL